MTYHFNVMSPLSALAVRDRAARNLFAPLLGDAASMLANGSDPLQPATDVREDDGGWTLEMELPGFAPDAVEVLAEGRMLTVRATRPETTASESSRAVRLERTRATDVTRQFRLPPSADLEHITATSADGVLTLRVGKVAPAKPRRVAVQVASPAAPAAPVSSAAPVSWAAEQSVTASLAAD